MKAVIALSVAQALINSALVGYGVGSAKPPVILPSAVVDAGAPARDFARAPDGQRRDPRAPAAVWAALRDGNERFVSGKTSPRDPLGRRAATSAQERPGAMVLSCSDSRTAPELLFDQDAGDLYVVRSAGGVVDDFDVASFEHGAVRLGAKVLVVLGHEQCDTVEDALNDDGAPKTAAKKALFDEVKAGIKDVDAHAGGAEKTAIVHSVRHHASQLLERSALLKRRVEAGDLLIVPAVYDEDSGNVRTLDPIAAPPPAAHGDDGHGDDGHGDKHDGDKHDGGKHDGGKHDDGKHGDNAAAHGDAHEPKH